MVIDLFGLREDEVRRRFPAVYQRVLLRVKPEREQNNRTSYKENWWIFGEPRLELRRAVIGIKKIIVTPVTAKHRVFSFLDVDMIPDDALISIAVDDPFILGVLSSHIHISWSISSGGTLEDRPRYLKSSCFDAFPFPVANRSQRAEIAAIAEELDAHRKARLAAYPHLTLTALYNVLAAIRAGTPLTPAERDTHDAGQVSILRTLHDRLDAAVAAAYGWPADLPDADIVARVVALNAERAAEEADGNIRWLRPEFQAPEETRRRAVQREMDVGEGAVAGLLPWPKDAPSQFTVLRAALTAAPASARDVARRFKGAPRPGKLEEMLATLAALGQARPAGGSRYAA